MKIFNIYARVKDGEIHILQVAFTSYEEAIRTINCPGGLYIGTIQTEKEVLTWDDIKIFGPEKRI